MKKILKNKIKIDIGPNHPLTQGALRLSVELDGEKILKCTPHPGYIHRGLEKTAQEKTFVQYLPLAEKVDFSGSFFHSQAYISTVEQLLDIELPKNAQYIRVLTMELNRIASHLLFLGHFLQDFHAAPPIFCAYNLANEILDIFKKITGSRITYNYYVFGGVKNKISNDILNNILDYITNFNKKIKILGDFIEKNPIFLSKTRGLGVITSEIALPYSITGINLRANGLPLDFRKEKPYLVYNELEFSLPTAFEGDCYSRCKLRLDEIQISINLVNQCIDWLLSHTEENVNLNLKPQDIIPKAGKAVSWTESARGLIMCHLIANGNKTPERLKWRTPSFYTLQLFEKIAENASVVDLPVIYNSLDISIPEVDR